MTKLSGWVVWAILAGLAQLATATIAAAEAIHSPHYDGYSVVVGALICTGVELILTAVFAFISAVE